MVAAFALHPSTTATSVRGDVVTDGPFLEAKEVVAGFYVIEAPDPDTALEVARRNPVTQQGGGVEGPARDLLDRGLNRVTAVGEAMADATSTWPRSACRRRTPRRWWPGPATASQATRRPG